MVGQFGSQKETIPISIIARVFMTPWLLCVCPQKDSPTGTLLRGCTIFDSLLSPFAGRLRDPYKASGVGLDRLGVQWSVTAAIKPVNRP